MNWYEGTKINFNIDTDELIITEKDD